ncbi:hypothetical protein MAP00_006152 [Monascus purpureus]|nr:hypothetical protein MAP00_006152 [Monascus purpureus]
MPLLPPEQLRSIASTLAQRLDTLQIDYAIMGGAAVCLLTHDPNRRTEDVDLVIHVDQRQITADRLTTQLLTSFPSDFGPVNQFGHIIPAYRLRLPGARSNWWNLKCLITKAGHSGLSTISRLLAEGH